ncbi:MAG TPA: 50S ribosomal protein L6 [Nitrospiraceae bacterium]|nr:50S ribosomal protein L6 [Nitrospiraceae bacterium]
MSRIGRKPINLSEGVDIKISGNIITVKGPKGELRWDFPANMKIHVDDDRLLVEMPSDGGSKALRGLTRNLIMNMITGVTTGYERILEISGVGYRAQLQGRKIVLSLGYSHPIEVNLPEGIQAVIDPKQTQITLKSIDKQLLGQVAADLRALRAPDIYKGKGVRYGGEKIKLKVGKAGKK